MEQKLRRVDRISSKRLQAEWSHLFVDQEEKRMKIDVGRVDKIPAPSEQNSNNYDSNVDEKNSVDIEMWEASNGDDSVESENNDCEFTDENSEAPVINEWDREDALNFIGSVFLYNKVSKTIGKDIFQISNILKNQPEIQIQDVWKVVDHWSDQGTRIYAFCGTFSTVLLDSKKCGNVGCSRYSLSQANVASSKMIVTFSIRKQVEDLLSNGSFDDTLLNRGLKSSSLSSRLCDTPQYKERISECETKYPDYITLLLTMNTDGFRKRGNSRGEVWPVFLAPSDVSMKKNSFEEYRPEIVMMSAIMLTTNKPNDSDFSSIFERLKNEIDDTTKNPIHVLIRNVNYKVRLEIYQCVLDMDASKKIYGYPCWQSYEGCSRCSVRGSRERTKKGSMICWFTQRETVIVFILKIILDHMVPNIRFEGSPLISSAAPFERLNQSLGRNTDVYTTRSLIDMTTKFMASHRANYYCEKAVAKTGSPVLYPYTMRAISEMFRQGNAACKKLDENELHEKEKDALRNHVSQISHFV
ncbi:hypothetical protein GCK72_013093 [Caenorhabditis remanei]|uniref:Uncharacterized protein n=1 Tax=Caenorhabditis remanei TaxID=31234 RepID=A0A6A5GQ92_CAERE|nr:hypothetical protein GCK72_013093 [Caenorhabditis remanei]KAF1756639.1 hypothetical protein GCK72_013093 [Caenorhabditis remanei]